MKRNIAAIALLLVLTLSCNWGQRRGVSTPEPEAIVNDTVYPLGFCTDSFRRVDGTGGGSHFLGPDGQPGPHRR